MLASRSIPTGATIPFKLNREPAGEPWRNAAAQNARPVRRLSGQLTAGLKSVQYRLATRTNGSEQALRG